MFPYQLPTAIITTLAIVQPQLVIAQEIAQINNIAKNITVKITGYGNGSGVIFERQGNIYSVITNHHVVPLDTNYEIGTYDGRKYRVISRQEILGLDLAIVQFESSQNYKIATMSDSDKINRLQRIYVAGFPGEQTDIDIISGEIRSIRQEILQNPQPEKGYALIYTNQTLPGSSGGAVLDAQGRLIAINGQAKRDLQTGRDISRGIPISLFLAAKKKPPVPPNNLSAPIVVPPNPVPAPNPIVFFKKAPRLIDAYTTSSDVRVRGATYYFDIQLPEDAAEPLQQIIISQRQGQEKVKFKLDKTVAYVGTHSKKKEQLNIASITQDETNQEIKIVFDSPIPPGTTFTVGIKPKRNPAYDGVYLFGVTAFPAGEKSKGLYLGVGRLHFYRGIS